MELSNANFTFTIEQNVLIIVDEFTELYPTPTVTKDIEAVLKEIKIEMGVLPLPERIIYRNTHGEWNRIIADTQTAKFNELTQIHVDLPEQVLDREIALEYALKIETTLNNIEKIKSDSETINELEQQEKPSRTGYYTKSIIHPNKS